MSLFAFIVEQERLLWRIRFLRLRLAFARIRCGLSARRG